MFLSVDVGCSQINSSVTPQGACGRRFLVLMVDDPRSTTTTPPREPIVDVLQLGGSCSQTSNNASQGGHYE
jgi:hypothetical protein